MRPATQPRSRNKLELKESLDKGVYVKDLTSYVVKSTDETQRVLQRGKRNRVTGATLMNQTSSRSHSIFTIVVECASSSSSGARDKEDAKAQQGGGKQHIRVGKLNLVDLAGKITVYKLWIVYTCLRVPPPHDRTHVPPAHRQRAAE